MAEKMATRSKTGQFLPGHPGNPNATGRPPRAIEERYLETLRATVTTEKWAEICKRAVADAARGDTAARTWLSKYLLPEPSHNVQIGGTLADLLAALAPASGSQLAD